MAKARLIRIDGTSDIVEISSLDDAADIIKGYIEILFMKTSVMMVDEDGRMAGKRPNEEATRLVIENGLKPRMAGWISGDVIICDRNDFEKM